MKKSTTERRKRRTTSEVEQDILEAIETLVVEKGFRDTPITAFIAEARIDPNIFYRRFENIYDVYNTLAKKYDFWVNNDINILDLGRLGDKKFLIEGMKKLLHNIRDNEMMQKLLLWELNDVNEITKRTSLLRDTQNSNLLLYYRQVFKDADFNILALIAILIAGSYYLTLHSGISTFCMIDFSTKEGQKILDDSIEKVIEILFIQLEHDKNQIRMAREMNKDGITHKNICKYLNITTKQLKQLLTQ